MILSRRPARRAPIAALALGLAAGLAWAALPVAVRAQTTSLTSGASDGGDAKPVEIEAEQGIEWRQDDQVYIARGRARVTRGPVTILGETITAYYRPGRKATGTKADTKADTKNDAALGGGTEVYRAVAEGNVRIATDTQTVYGDVATYDVDTASVVVTGRNLRLETTQDVITARDSLEWYDAKQIAVARGNAIASRETKRLTGDVLTAQVIKPANEPSRVSRVDAFGNVLVSTTNEIARGDTGVYNVDTGIATLAGNVKITRGNNEMRGQYGVVDMNSNVSRLLSAPPAGMRGLSGPPPRVQGIIIPNSKPEPPK